MGMSFLSPMLLAAAALVAVPWFLHHIRRPEREPVRFSSLMFVPEIKREVIERRRLQHLLLMLLRMLIVALLAYAFARPFIPILAGATEEPGAERHVILLDASYSLGANEAFAAAKDAARDIVRGLDSDDRVAVVAFGQHPRVLAPLGPAEDAEMAIDAARLTFEATDYEAALRRGVEILSEEGIDPDNPRASLHLVSDFQRQGLPERATGWRVPSYITFNPVVIGEDVENEAVTDLAIHEREPGRLQLRAKLRNWSRAESRPIEARLVRDGQVRETKRIDVAPGNASQVVFDLETAGDGAATGWIEIDDEALPADNRRYFAWNPARKRQVLVVDDAPETTRWPAARLIRYALPDEPNSPWSLRTVAALAPEDLEDCDVLLLAGNPSDAAALRETALPYIERGGRALLCVQPTADAETKDRDMLRALGIESSGLRFPDETAQAFSLFSWMDFSHPVFHPFTDARYNDFSDVRFYNHRLVAVQAPDDGEKPAARVVARFEPLADDAGPPAVIETTFGKGRVLVWVFPVDLRHTTLPRSPRFVPLLHESLRLLSGEQADNRAWLVGERAAPPRPDLQARRVTGDGDAEERTADALEVPGFVEWREDGEEQPLRVDPVNVRAEEGDPKRVTPEEFALRLCSAPVVTAQAGQPGAAGTAAGDSAMEYGRYILAAIAAALLLESLYASRLAQADRK